MNINNVGKYMTLVAYYDIPRWSSVVPNLIGKCQFIYLGPYKNNTGLRYHLAAIVDITTEECQSMVPYNMGDRLIQSHLPQPYIEKLQAIDSSLQKFKDVTWLFETEIISFHDEPTNSESYKMAVLMEKIDYLWKKQNYYKKFIFKEIQ